MVGSAVETMVWSRAASSMPSTTAAKTALVRPRLRAKGASVESSGVAAVGPGFLSFATVLVAMR